MVDGVEHPLAFNYNLKKQFKKYNTPILLNVKKFKNLNISIVHKLMSTE